MLKRLFSRKRKAEALSAVSVRVDDSQGWTSLTSRPHDYDPATMQELYQDALTAWRKNPIAWRIIGITTDYCVGDDIRITSTNRTLNRFIQAFWNHPQNRMALRLESMSDELARAGDLFVLMFRNQQDGMSYIRFVTKDRIEKIETAPNDWETELAYYEVGVDGASPGGVNPGDSRKWLSPEHPGAAEAEAVMLHYAINRPQGALMGESDLTTMLPWLQRYSRMLEDRVRLNWAVRAFLWIVTVPANRVREKQEQYHAAPEAGSIIVKDESESWDVRAPTLHAQDARADLQAVRGMIDAGSGYPPHWRGEAGDANLATATAMQGPTERHLLRRQQYFGFMLQDILYHAYQRAAEAGAYYPLKEQDYARLFTMQVPEISRWDNESLARAAQGITSAVAALTASLPQQPPTLARWVLRLAFRFAGEPLNEEDISAIMQEIQERKDEIGTGSRKDQTAQ